MAEITSTTTCLITRGVAPARCVIDTALRTRDLGFNFRLIESLPAVTAKNRAVELADQDASHLLLIEDDIIAPADAWCTIARMSPQACEQMIAFCSAIDRSGQPNIYRSTTGELLWSGTVFLWIPRPILERLPRPLFHPIDYGLTPDGTLTPIGVNKQGHHSDVHAWQQLRALHPRPEFRHLGQALHHLHRGNKEHDLNNPYRFDIT